MQRELPQDAFNQFQSFQRGEESGFTYFFKALYKPALQYANSLLDNEAAAEDIVEESFIKLWEKRGAVQGAVAVKSYLYAIVRNGCLDCLRRSKTTGKALKDLEAFAEKDTNPLQEIIVLPELHTNIKAAVEQLPRRKRQIFSMFHLQHKSIQQIATELNLSAGSVKNQKSRALELLRLYLLRQTVKKA